MISVNMLKRTTHLLTVVSVLIGTHLLNSESLAQQQDQSLSVVGQIEDQQSGEAVEGATVAVLAREDSSLVNGSVSEESGQFEVEGLQPGSYLVRVTYVGYEPLYEERQISEDQPEKNLGVLEIQPGDEQLDEVTVEAERERVTVESGRTIYDADQMVSGSGATATELLEEIPSVDVDTEGNVSYRGSESVVIQVNGRPIPDNPDARQAYLQSISSDDIENVEIISNPSASEDPEGVGGIINIELREDAGAGLTGRISGDVDTRGGYNPGASLGYNSSELRINGSYNYRKVLRDSELQEEREYMGQDPYYMYQDGGSDFTGNHHTVTVSTEYQPTESATFNLENFFGFMGMDNDQFRQHSYEQAPEDFSDQEMMMNERYDGMVSDNSLSYSHQLRGENHLIEGEAGLNYMYQDMESLQSFEFPDSEQNLDQQVEMHALHSDFNAESSYFNELHENVQFEGGIEYRMRNTVQELDDPASTFSDFDYRLNTASGYTILNFDQNPVNIEAGLRVEHADMMFDYLTSGETTDYDRQYVNLFPSASAGYQFNPQNQISLNYSKRINRPEIFHMLPDLSPMNPDPTHQISGNPELEPELTHSAELTYNLTGETYSVNVQPYMRHTTNVIRRQLQEVDGDILHYTYKNLAQRNDYGAEVSTDLSIAQSLNIGTSLDIYQAVIDGTDLGDDLESRALGWNASGNVSYRLPIGLMVQVMGQYQAPVDTEHGWRGSQKMLNLALRQGFLADQLQVSLSFRDILNSAGQDIRYETGNMRHYSENRFSQPTASLSISFSFGGEQQEQPQEEESSGLMPF